VGLRGAKEAGSNDESGLIGVYLAVLIFKGFPGWIPVCFRALDARQQIAFSYRAEALLT